LYLDFDKKATAEIPKTNKAMIGLTIHEIWRGQFNSLYK
jgi:hypothetical protein